MERDFSHTMSQLRKERGLSQRRAAADLNISQALLSHYENGAREPGLDFVCRACRYYGVSADYLLGLSDQPSGSSREADALEALVKELGALSAAAQKTWEELNT
ncbi:MAG: helix-turn-helix domain-containing protein [Oscillospiraceae bacterium]